MKRGTTHILVAVTVAAVAAAGGCADASSAQPDPGTTVVDSSVADHELLDDILAVDAKRSAGAFNFSYVPQTRPEGLTGLTANTVGTTVVDGYQLAGGPVQLFAEFAAEPTDTCDGMKKDPGSGVCVRDEQLAAAADDPKMRNLTVYFSQTATASTAPDAAAANDIRRFWSTVKMVPASNAAWFTELLEQAKTAPKTTAG